jgi:Tfp pilus assembly protein PilN
VQLLDHVSRSLPEMLWLTDLKEEGDFLTIEGRTTTLIGLSDFVNNLGTSAVLHKPIEILDSAAEGGESKTAPGPELIKFTVRAGLNGLPPQEEPAKGSAKKKVKR